MIKWSEVSISLFGKWMGMVILIFIITISVIAFIIPLLLTLKLGERKIGGLDVVRMQYIPLGSISFHPNTSNNDN